MTSNNLKPKLNPKFLTEPECAMMNGSLESDDFQLSACLCYGRDDMVAEVDYASLSPYCQSVRG